MMPERGILFTNCIFYGLPPNGFEDWHAWAKDVQERGVCSGIKIQSLNNPEKVRIEYIDEEVPQ